MMLTEVQDGRGSRAEGATGASGGEEGAERGVVALQGVLRSS